MFLIPALILCVSCGSPDKLDPSRQFTLGPDSKLHCPVCGSPPNAIKYIRAEDPDEGDGANDHNHFMVSCGMCGHKGWATIEDTKAAVNFQNGNH